jgi:hypothetical protein
MKKYSLIVLAFLLVSCLEQATEPKGISIILLDDLPIQFYDWEDFEVTGFSPSVQLVGSPIYIHGKAFGVDRDSVKVMVGPLEAEIISITDTMITASVPELYAGYYYVTLSIKDTLLQVSDKIIQVVRSKYIYSNVQTKINNVICERKIHFRRLYFKDQEVEEKITYDTSLYSFELKNTGGLVVTSEGNLYSVFSIADHPAAHGFSGSVLINENSQTLKNYDFASKRVKRYESERDYNYITNKLKITECSYDILNDSLLYAHFDRQDLNSLDFLFTSYDEYFLWSFSSRTFSTKSYNILSLTDSSEIILKFTK